MIHNITLSLKFPGIVTRATNALNSVFLFNLFDDSIADLLCLKTYTHGTSPKNYHQIMKFGADPTRGGKGGENGLYKAFGSSHKKTAKKEDAQSGWNCKNRFFAFPPEAPELMRRWQPRVYCIAACIGENCSFNQNKLIKGAWIILSIFQGIFCVPSLKFRFRTDDSSCKFTWDKTFSQDSVLAAYTENPISPKHIGLLGSIHEGVNGKWIDRVKKYPFQLMAGIAKLIVTITLLALTIIGAKKYPFATKVLSIYMTVKTIQVFGRFFFPILYDFRNRNF